MPDPDSNASPDPPPELVRWHDIPATRWTLVGRAGMARAGGEGPKEARAALEELLRLYLPVLRGHLVTTLRIAPERADDLLQGFLVERVLERDLIAQADATRGRFRRFILTALNRYVTDTHRRESAAKRQPGSGPPLSVEALGDRRALEPTAGEQFDRLWAAEAIGEAVRRTHQTCEEKRRMDLWIILESRILQPISAGTPPVPHDRLARELQLPGGAAEAANLLTTAKQVFIRAFREVVADYVVPLEFRDSGSAELEKAIDQETQELWSAFTKRSG